MPGDIIILYKCIKNHDHMLYCSWDMASGRCYFSFWAIFCPLPPWQPEKLNFKKITPPPPKTGDIIILQECTRNHNHMVYCSWDAVRDGCDCYFSFWAIICRFTPLTAQKFKISKKWRKRLEISYYICVPKIVIRWCMVSEIWCAIDLRKKWHIEWEPHLKTRKHSIVAPVRCPHGGCLNFYCKEGVRRSSITWN